MPNGSSPFLHKDAGRPTLPTYPFSNKAFLLFWAEISAVDAAMTARITETKNLLFITLFNYASLRAPSLITTGITIGS